MFFRKRAMKTVSLLLVLAMCLGMTIFLASAEEAAYQLGDFVEEGDPSCEHLFSYDNPTEELRDSCTEIGYYLLICPKCGAKRVYGVLNPTTHKYANGVCRWCGAIEPGSSTNPGTTTNPGGTTNPGTTTNPGGTTNPGTTTNPGGTTDPGTTTNPGTAIQPGNTGCTTHRYKETITREPTVDREGIKTFTCSVCGDIYTESIDKLPRSSYADKTGLRDSGSTTLSKLSQQEIERLLAQAPLIAYDEDVFDVQPSCDAPYRSGKIKDWALNATLDRLNALRRITGLPSVVMEKSFNEKAQASAVIQAHVGSLSHHPNKPADMSESFYQNAYEGSYRSVIAAGNTLNGAVDEWMNDVPHRLWQLDPNVKRVGFGHAVANRGYGSYTAEYIVDAERRDFTAKADFDYDFIAWPASGNFPASLFDSTQMWSVCLNRWEYADLDHNNIKVTVSREEDGKTWVLDARQDKDHFYTTNYAGYADISKYIAFELDGIEYYDGIYTVQIDGLQSKNGQKVKDFRYQVNFFGAKSGESATNPTYPTTPANPTDPTTPTITVDNIPARGTAYVSNQTVTVDGRPVQFQMYALKDANNNLTNYIKLRDMAYILNGTQAQFAVGYDGTISVTTGQRYTVSGTEMTTPFSGNRSYRGGAQSVKVNSAPVNMTAITLTDANGGDYNYFKLRDLGMALGFNVSWKDGSVVVESDRPYEG